jgi:hypothetical protein
LATARAVGLAGGQPLEGAHEPGALERLRARALVADDLDDVPPLVLGGAAQHVLLRVEAVAVLGLLVGGDADVEQHPLRL